MVSVSEDPVAALANGEDNVLGNMGLKCSSPQQGTGSDSTSMELGWKRYHEGWQSRTYSDSFLGAGCKQCLGCELWLSLHQGASQDRCCSRKALS